METKEKMDTDSIVAKPEYASSEFSSEAPPVSPKPSRSRNNFFSINRAFNAFAIKISWAIISSCLPFYCVKMQFKLINNNDAVDDVHQRASRLTKAAQFSV
jgi:hypothetical protein